MQRKEIFAILLFSFFFFLSIVVINSNLTFRLDSDYDMLFSYYTYVVSYVRTEGMLPRFHPYAGLGLPLAGDPGISYYNPLFILPLVYLGLEKGMFSLILIAMTVSGISMWWLLWTLKTPRVLRMWGALLYLTSGALFARFATGHVGFFLSYPLWPIFFALLLPPPTFSRKKIVALGALIAYFFLSGDIYAVWFSAIFYGVSQLFYLVHRQKSIITTIKEGTAILLSFFLISAVKLYFLFVDVLPIFARSLAGTPHGGSIHAIFSLFPFIIPFTVSFYDRPFFQRFLGFYYNWYEYYAFIAPLPLLFLIPLLRKKIHTIQFFPPTTSFLSLYALLFSIGILYLALAFPYSLFYWLFHFFPTLSLFHVPQRIVLPLSSLFVVGLVTLSARWMNAYPKHHILSSFILGTTILWTAATSLHAIHFAFEKPRIHEQSLVRHLRAIDSTDFTLMNLVCCNQTFLVEANIRVLNFYAGWRPKTTPTLTDTQGNLDYEKLKTIRPKYILAPNTLDLNDYEYRNIFRSNVGTIWITDRSTI